MSGVSMSEYCCTGHLVCMPRLAQICPKLYFGPKLTVLALNSPIISKAMCNKHMNVV